MLNGGERIIFDQEIINGLNSDVLRDPPVVCGEGEGGSAGGTIDNDLIAAGDGEGDIGGGCGAENSAIDDGGAGVFCQAWCEFCLLEEEELVGESRS